MNSTKCGFVRRLYKFTASDNQLMTMIWESRILFELNLKHRIDWEKHLNFFIASNWNKITVYEICLKLTIKTPEQRHSSVSIADFEQVNVGWICPV